MVAAPPAERREPAATRVPNHRRARIFVLCGLLMLIALVAGLLVRSSRHDPAEAASDAISDAAIIATPQPGAPTPTPLAKKPTATSMPAPTATRSPPPTSIPPTDPPPVVAAPAVQPMPANVAPGSGQINGKGKHKAKEKD